MSGTVPLPSARRITIIGQPWSKKRPRISKAVRGRSPRTHQDPEDKRAEQQTRDQMSAQWPQPPITGNIRLHARIFRSGRQVVDLDNLVKHLQDSGNGVLWVDDCQITALDVELDIDRDNPRSELWMSSHETGMVRTKLDPRPGSNSAGG